MRFVHADFQGGGIGCGCCPSCAITPVTPPGARPTADGRARPALRADAERVREATGFVIGGVAPLGYPSPADCDRRQPRPVRDGLRRRRAPALRLPDHAPGAQPADRRRRHQGHRDHLSDDSRIPGRPRPVVASPLSRDRTRLVRVRANGIARSKYVLIPVKLLFAVTSNRSPPAG